MTRYPEREPSWTMPALMRPIESPDGAWSLIGRHTDRQTEENDRLHLKKSKKLQIRCGPSNEPACGRSLGALKGLEGGLLFSETLWPPAPGVKGPTPPPG